MSKPLEAPKPAPAPVWNSTPSVETTARWIRVKCAGQTIADSRQALFLRQYGPGGMPTYYFPQSDVRLELLRARPATPDAADREYRDISFGDRLIERGAWIHRGTPPHLAALAGYVSFQWNAMEAWYEEEEEIFVHARDPHARVDAIRSSRHIRVEVSGVTLADTRRPVFLFETGLPPRFYIPAEDVRREWLVPSQLTSRCPYKGLASYWSVSVNGKLIPNIVWAYADPIAECPKIRGLFCFFNERTDHFVDGELSPRPQTPWSESE